MDGWMDGWISIYMHWRAGLYIYSRAVLISSAWRTWTAVIKVFLCGFRAIIGRKQQHHSPYRLRRPIFSECSTGFL